MDPPLYRDDDGITGESITDICLSLTNDITDPKLETLNYLFCESKHKEDLFVTILCHCPNEIIKYFIKKYNFDFNANQQIINAVVANCDLNIIKLIHSQGANLNTKGAPLTIAITLNDMEKIKYLIDNKVEIKDYHIARAKKLHNIDLLKI